MSLILTLYIHIYIAKNQDNIFFCDKNGTTIFKAKIYQKVVDNILNDPDPEIGILLYEYYICIIHVLYVLT